MSLITLFQDKIKPYKLKGTGIINPLNTSHCNEHLSCVRQDDVNFWLYTKNNTTIAIDTGYKDNADLLSELAKINIKNENVHSVFITHADIDHAGGLLSENKFAPNAKVYLHELEEDMILGNEKRFTVAFLKLKNPVVYSGNYTKIKDREVIDINGIKVECFHTPGHTRGHSCYLVDDKYFFTGDSIATNENGGYCFFDFYNMDTSENISSLMRLKGILTDNSIEVYTSHNGSQKLEKAFAHITQVAKGSKKAPFDKTAPYDCFLKNT